MQNTQKDSVLFVTPIFPFDELASLEERISRLENAFVLSLSCFQLLVERIESKLGPEFLGADFGRLSGIGTDAELRKVIERIDQLIGEGRKPLATRQFREAFGVTWDQAHDAIARWRDRSIDEKLRWLRLVRFIRAFAQESSK